MNDKIKHVHLVDLSEKIAALTDGQIKSWYVATFTFDDGAGNYNIRTVSGCDEFELLWDAGFTIKECYSYIPRTLSDDKAKIWEFRRNE